MGGCSGGRGEGEQVRTGHGQWNRPDAGPQGRVGDQERAEDITEGEEADSQGTYVVMFPEFSCDSVENWDIGSHVEVRLGEGRRREYHGARPRGEQRACAGREQEGTAAPGSGASLPTALCSQGSSKRGRQGAQGNRRRCETVLREREEVSEEAPLGI